MRCPSNVPPGFRIGTQTPSFESYLTQRFTVYRVLREQALPAPPALCNRAERLHVFLRHEWPPFTAHPYFLVNVW